MTQPFFELALDHAFGSDATKQACHNYLDKLQSVFPRIRQQPQREAEPVFSLPSETGDIADIEEMARSIADHCHTLMVVGMGGSSLSAETLACIAKPSALKLTFVDNIDPYAMDRLVRDIVWKDTAFLVISKSGNTAETLAQMAIFLRHAKTAGVDISRHFYVITIPNGNPLHSIAKACGIKVLAHDPKLGGRFSILSSVGLVPAAAIGMDIRALRSGAKAVLNAPEEALQSAALHRALMDHNIRISVLMHYGDCLGGLASWWRQCWGESLGKCELATTPVRSRGATDQHSQAQLYLDGPKNKFFSLLLLESQGKGDAIGYDGIEDGRLDFLKGRTLGDLMAAEQRGTLETLVARGCPVRSFAIKAMNEETMGALLMHFMLEVIFTAELLPVNAFDQPAVEEGKALALRYLKDA